MSVLSEYVETVESEMAKKSVRETTETLTVNPTSPAFKIVQNAVQTAHVVNVSEMSDEEMQNLLG